MAERTHNSNEELTIRFNDRFQFYGKSMLYNNKNINTSIVYILIHYIPILYIIIQYSIHAYMIY